MGSSLHRIVLLRRASGLATALVAAIGPLGLGQPVPVTSGPGLKIPTEFFPDGSRLMLYAPPPPGEENWVYQVDYRAGFFSLLPVPVLPRIGPTWSRDMKRLALFGGWYSVPHYLAYVHPSQRAVSLVSYVVGIPTHVRFSPCSRHVSFLLDPGCPLPYPWCLESPHTLWRTVPPGGAGRAAIVLLGGGSDVTFYEPEWSPDGMYISCVRGYPVIQPTNRMGLYQDVLLITPDGRSERVLVTYPPMAPNPWRDVMPIGPVWSPRGDRLAWAEISGGPGRVAVWEAVSGVITRMGALVQRRSPPVWSPDGRYLLTDRYHSETYARELRRIDVITGEEVVLVPPGSRNSAVTDYVWSPLGDLVAFAMAPDANGWQQVYVLDPGIGVVPAAVGTFEPGTEVRFRLEATRFAGRRYVLALSLQDSPGIPTGAGVVPLSPDALFFASLAQGPAFRNFTGRLNSLARADAFFAIPDLDGLRGLRFFAAYVVLDESGRISLISRARAMFVL